MDTACLDYRLTEEERVGFEQHGFLVVENVLPPEMIKDLTTLVDRLDAQYRTVMGLGPHDVLELIDFVGKDDLFLELLDWPKTFAKVWQILGWHIQLYHSHMTVTPPVAPSERGGRMSLGWHQDSGRLNIDLEGNPRPRVSLKVGYFLTDTTEVGRGNFRMTARFGSCLSLLQCLLGFSGEPVLSNHLFSSPRVTENSVL